MRSKFDKELKQMNDDLIEMGTLLETALSQIIVVLNDFDDIAMQTISDCEIAVDEYEREIHSKALKLLCFQQPVAKDLRAVSTALNMITDMERIADQAVDISEIAMQFKNKPKIKNPVHIIAMIEKCIIMVKKSIDAFVNKDIKLANLVISSDDEVDELFIFVRNELIELINFDMSNGEQAIDFIMIAKYLERIADHAVNISEWVIFSVTGEHKNEKLM